MFNRNNTDWSLLARYLARETNETEKAAVEKWLGKSAKNRAEFGKLKSDWKIMENMKQFDVNSAWHKLHGRILDHEAPVPGESGKGAVLHRRMLWGTPIRIAASLLLLLALGASIALAVGRFRRITITTSANEHFRNVNLPDGSTVIMNANTTLTYMKHFRGNSRNVSLTGEAFFDVAPDSDMPFVIMADDVAIRVAGTSFNVDTKGISFDVEVYVSTGIVELYKPGSNESSVLLHPGELGTITGQLIQSRKARNENSIAWKTGRMDFEGIALSEAVAMLNELYNVNIILMADDLKSVRMEGEYIYPEEPLDTILRVFCRQNFLTVEKSDNKIYLSK